MTNTDNHAGRLYELLEQYTEAANNVSIADAWAGVLKVPKEELMFHIGGVMRLVRETRLAYEDLNDSAWAPIVGHLQTLSQAIMPLGVAWQQQKGNALPDQTAMTFLAAFSSHLHSLASEGDLPGEEELEELRASVQELIADMAEADINPHIKRILLSRLNDVLEALEHLGVYGADGTRKALAALGDAAAWYGDVAADKSMVARIKSVAKKGIIAFSAVVFLANGVLTIDNAAQRVDHILDPPKVQTQQQNLLPPASEQKALPPAGETTA